MGRIGMPEVIFIVFVVILLFGVKRLPEIGRSLGDAIREFKKASKGVKNDIEDALKDEDTNRKT